MRTRLIEIAEIRPGYTFRRPSREAFLSPHRVLQIKDITPSGKIDVTSVSTMDLPGVNDRYLLWHGEVVLSARGTRNQAAVYGGEFDEIVPGAQFWVIRVNRQQILPEYLAWYLNEPATQRYLAGRARGTYIAMLPKKTVMDLPVPVPPLHIQQQLVAVHELAIRERELLEALREKRAELVSTLCNQAAERFSTGSKQ